MLGKAAAGVVAAGLVLAFVAAPDAGGLCWYFTIQVCAGYLLLAPFRAAWAGPVRTALVVYLVVAGLVFVLVLANPWNPYSMAGDPAARGTVSDLGNLLLHVVAPPLALAAWWRDRPVLRHRGRLLLLLPVYPLGYLAAILLRGTEYLYSFLDVPAIGYPATVRNAVMLAAVTVATGLVVTRARH
ncbi:Pr6Pr family membrane protein [Paractinoplanes rishiriensis]|uniref:Uncharacterized protein n=1 Tax=Paractinoplanes rishiriensis TaxID=1050105 RepID=A0A919K405_9ACTN|nr:Pr6Pr family membrane protein [Actinoplanes rishiriensis]GIE98560.1 hypothetical protein Ari01nite_60250 [Actinoplanes rishiriensis]